MVTLTDFELAEALNIFFVSVNADIPALDINRLPVYLPVTEEVPTIEPYIKYAVNYSN